MARPPVSKNDSTADWPSLQLESVAQAQGFRNIAGVDEAGRGPLAGPVVVVAVILGPDWDINHPLQDSKRIPGAERERLFPIIRKQAQACRIIAVSPKAIDESNILQATLDGMSRSLRELHTPADYALVDGNRFPTMGLPGEAVVKGDSHSCSIAAASILAKVARDRIMRVYGQRYPEWGFEQHFGYPTPKHREAIQRHGLSPIHRRTFRWKPRPAQLDLL